MPGESLGGQLEQEECLMVACTGFASAVTFLLTLLPAVPKSARKGLVAYLCSVCFCDSAQRGSWKNWLPVVLKAPQPPLLLHTVGNVTKGR